MDTTQQTNRFSNSYSETSITLSKERMSLNLSEIDSSKPCKLGDLQLFHDPSVFSPECFRSSFFYTQNIPYPTNGTFLDVGTGIGITAVIAAMKHGNHVVATDINPKAVELAEMNIKKYNLENQVECRKGSIFDPISENEKFDMIYWNWPFIFAPNNFEFQNPLENSIIDPGYLQIRKFLSEVKNYLKQDGKIVLTFASHAKEDAFDQILFENGFVKEEINSEKIDSITYNLYLIKQIFCG